MPAKPIRLVAVGDLSFNGRYHELLKRRGPNHPFRFVSPAWREADLRLGNLESPITAAPKACPSKLTLRSTPCAAASLRAAGFDCVALANNHMLDFGPQGLADSRAALDAAGIAHVGAGQDDASAAAPIVLNRQGQTIGVAAFCRVENKSPLYAGPNSPGIAALDVEAAVRNVEELRSRLDWLIVQIHWGVELSSLPSPEQRLWARRLAKAGADLILGHHPHVVQPMEKIGRTPVFYSLGNFLFSDMYWKGRAPGGDSFLTKLRLHPLSRRTGWAEIVLERGRPTLTHFHFARIGRDLTVRPVATGELLREWNEQCTTLTDLEYERRVSVELDRAEARREWASAWRPWRRRFEMRLVHHGLAPFALEGD